MKEIGGYFELEQLITYEHYKDLIPLNSGRNALLYLLQAKKIRKVYIPSYLCDVVSIMLKMHDYDFEFYSVDADFMPVFKKTLQNGEFLYIINYYGQLTDEKVIALKKKYCQVIMDYTHSFFQKPIPGVDTIYSCRKFFGVPDGAYLATNIILNKELDTDISQNRMTHLLGRYEGLASEYYNTFRETDEAFKSEPIKYMSKLTHNILGAIDYDKVRQIRNENYAYISSLISKKNELKLVSPDGAFAYPFYIENGIKIRKILAQDRLYIPTLWPNVLTDTPEESIEHKYAANILPLPCDQRYGMKEIEYFVEMLEKHF